MPTVASFFWVVFVLISAFIMLSLFIGAVTVSMGEMMAEVREQNEEEKKKVGGPSGNTSPQYPHAGMTADLVVSHW